MQPGVSPLPGVLNRGPRCHGRGPHVFLYQPPGPQRDSESHERKLDPLAAGASEPGPAGPIGPPGPPGAAGPPSPAGAAGSPGLNLREVGSRC